jgi:glyceraldehyde-3-phosphate dehydrogenase/erythrose-4-phosphate dehydrogenase
MTRRSRYLLSTIWSTSKILHTCFALTLYTGAIQSACPSKAVTWLSTAAGCARYGTESRWSSHGKSLESIWCSMTTIHAYTSSQSIVDGPNKRFRRGRAAGANLVPATTGAAIATTRALPEYAGRFDGMAIRAPVPVGSIADLTFVASRRTSVDEVNEILSDEAESKRYAGVLGVSRDPRVSSDIVGDSRASIVDLDLTKVIDGDLVKIMSWYDNEWGYANQMLREALAITGAPE